MTEAYTPSEPVPFVPVVPEPRIRTVEKIVYRDKPDPPGPLYKVNVKEQFWEHVSSTEAGELVDKLRVAGLLFFEVVRE